MNKNLEYIANGINAASKIKSIRSDYFRNNSGDNVVPENITLLYDILQTIVEYSPDPHKERLNRTFEKSRLYRDTYKDLKQHLRVITNSKMDKDSLIKTLSIIKPVVDNQRSILIEKILKIYEILSL